VKWEFRLDETRENAIAVQTWEYSQFNEPICLLSVKLYVAPKHDIYTFIHEFSELSLVKLLMDYFVEDKLPLNKIYKNRNWNPKINATRKHYLITDYMLLLAEVNNY